MLNQFGPVVKNLLLLNIVVFILDMILQSKGIFLKHFLGLHSFNSPHFKPYQLITHLFVHGGIFHLFMNMYAIIIFGTILERIWGIKRFFIFYFSCGIFAGLFTSGIDLYTFYKLKPLFSEEVLNQVYYDVKNWEVGYIPNYNNFQLNQLVKYYSSCSFGASGAVFGVLAAFAWLFPNTELQLIFPPIPVKAKWLIGIYVLYEVYMAFSGKMDGIGHWAHIGGAIMGTIFIFIWKQNKKSFY
jgi:membrane associated rhomboid family serine protease